MKRMTKWMGTSGLGAVLLLTACNLTSAPQHPARTQSMNHTAHQGQTSDTVIPSVDRDKKMTTNQHGTTYSGMGTNLYSTIGSSGLHGGGPSANVEARLNAAGIHGVQALIINDAVVLAPSSANSRSVNQMDAMQSHLLSNFTGSSSRGPESHGKTTGTAGTLGTSDRNYSMTQARTQIKRMYGADTQILTVTSPKGIAALERVKKQMRTGNHSAKMADDIAKVLREAKSQR